MNKLRNNFIYFSISCGGVSLCLFLFSFSNVNAQAVLQKRTPVPSYDNIISSNETTQVTIPESLKVSWLGNFQITIRPLLTFPNYSIEGLIGKQYLSLEINRSEEKTYRHNPEKIYKWTEQVSKNVDSEAFEPKLEIKDNRAVEFIPPQVGKKLDRFNSTLQILKALEENQTVISLAVLTTTPTRGLAQLNELGITELIGRGESDFSGSPANRRHNIKVGVQKMTGVIIKPDEEFSFNKYLGPVEASEGFLPELVIKGNDTIPELGGGLCQVSSTTFRAIMHAGLPVTQRKNHSYAVQYYAPQGSDATIYPGVVDLKFRNDTGKSILIWPYFKSATRLVFDFYGTDDGREVDLKQPVAYDKQSNGAMKATWTRIVKKNGVEEKDSFSSTYKPPADFHQSQQFVGTDGRSTEKPNANPVKVDPKIEFFVGEKPNPTPTDNTVEN